MLSMPANGWENLRFSQGAKAKESGSYREIFDGTGCWLRRAMLPIQKKILSGQAAVATNHLDAVNERMVARRRSFVTVSRRDCRLVSNQLYAPRTHSVTPVAVSIKCSLLMKNVTVDVSWLCIRNFWAACTNPQAIPVVSPYRPKMKRHGGQSMGT